MRIYEAFKPGVILADQLHGEPAQRLFCLTKREAREKARVLNGGQNLRKGKTNVKVLDHDLRGKPAFIDFLNRVMRSATPIKNGNVMRPPLLKGPEEPALPAPAPVPFTGKTKTVLRYLERTASRPVHKRVRPAFKDALHVAEMELRWRKRFAKRVVVVRTEQRMVITGGEDAPQYLRAIKRPNQRATEPGVIWTYRLVEAKRFSKPFKANEYLLKFDTDKASNKAMQKLRAASRVMSISQLTR